MVCRYFSLTKKKDTSLAILMLGEWHRLTESLKCTLQVGRRARGATAQLGQAECGMGGEELEEESEVRESSDCPHSFQLGP